jgi:hypothetical protein
MADARTQALAKELAKANYDADDLPNLARNIYVRCLLKVHSVGGRSGQAKDLSLQVTGEVMKEIVGMHFGAKDVQALLDEQEGGAKKKDDGAPAEPAKPKPSLDPHDLGL